MQLEDIVEYLHALPESEETYPFGPSTAVFKTKGKMFALLSVESDESSINLKCNPDKAIELRAEYPNIIPGYHMNKKHWNTVKDLEQIKPDFLKNLIHHSWELVYTSVKAGKK